MDRNEGTGNGKVFRMAGVALALLVGGVMGACDDDVTGPEDTARIQVLLTDAPTDMLDSAHVWISRVYVVGGADDDTLAAGGPVDLFNDPSDPQRFDLLTLRDGVTADLTGEVEVPLADYQQLRFVVDSARVTLTEGLSFEDGSRSASLFVPSGGQSGIKVQLADILDPDAGETLVITVDADVNQNFVIQMNPQTGEVRRILFTPVLKELRRVEEES